MIDILDLENEEFLERLPNILHIDNALCLLNLSVPGDYSNMRDLRDVVIGNLLQTRIESLSNSVSEVQTQIYQNENENRINTLVNNTINEQRASDSSFFSSIASESYARAQRYLRNALWRATGIPFLNECLNVVFPGCTLPLTLVTGISSAFQLVTLLTNETGFNSISRSQAGISMLRNFITRYNQHHRLLENQTDSDPENE